MSKQPKFISCLGCGEKIEMPFDREGVYKVRCIKCKEELEVHLSIMLEVYYDSDPSWLSCNRKPVKRREENHHEQVRS